VVLASQRTFNARVGVGHGDEAQLVRNGCLFATVAAGSLLARRVLVKTGQQHKLVGAALLELVRTGANKVFQWRRNRLLGHDGRHARGQGQLRQQGGIRGFQREFDAVSAADCQVRHLPGKRLAAWRHVHPALEAGHHIFGVELAAVVQLHALAQGDAVVLAVSRNLRHVFGEHGDHLPVGVKRVQRLIDVLHDGAHQVGGGGHRVQRLGLGNHGQVER